MGVSKGLAAAIGVLAGVLGTMGAALLIGRISGEELVQPTPPPIEKASEGKLYIPFGPSSSVYEENCRICGGQLRVHGRFCTTEDKACYAVVRCARCGALFLPTANLEGKLLTNTEGQVSVVDKNGRLRTLGKDAENYLASEGRIGVNLTAREDGEILVEQVLPGLLGETSGVKAGDRVKSVDGVAVSGEAISVVRERLRLDPGESTRVIVIRDGTQKEIVIRRPMTP